MPNTIVLDLELARMPNWSKLGFERFTPMPLGWAERQHVTHAIVNGVIFGSVQEAEEEALALNVLRGPLRPSLAQRGRGYLLREIFAYRGSQGH